MSSLLLGIWVAAIPGIKLRLGLTDASLGLSLLLAPVGALTGVMVAPYVFKKIPVGQWMVRGHILYCLIFIAQVMAVSPAMLWVALYFNGLTGFLNGVSTNSVVDIVEKQYNRRIMSTSHGMYSLGGGISAGLTAIFYAVHLTPIWQITIVAAVLITLLLLQRKHLLQYAIKIQSDTSFRLPSGSVIGLAFICFVSFMGEGCVADWSALYLRESLHGSKVIAGLGFAGFSVAMAIGRLNGDALIPKVGSKNIVIAGCLVASLGFLLAIGFGTVPTAIAGFTLIGFGFCCVVPILFSAASRVPGVSPVNGIAAVASGGLIGFLAGPSLIGLIAEEYSIAWGLSILFFLSLAAAIFAWKNDFLINRHSRAPEVNYNDQHY
ncbi:MFS transporter [Flavihumibacter petaseus]|uniref:MFS transporter n=1 Tax=Flavihumibacter petaseus TaxID=549295 RepID=UPI0014706DFC|nr:MFS transporter [Flavihumibacter petaseus]